MQEIYKAMIEFQKELSPVVKDSIATITPRDGKAKFSYAYAKLEEIIEHVMPILNKHDLGFTQTSRIEGMDNVLQTIIFHKSGEKILSEMFLPVASDAQKTGAAITYFKRYMLQAALGLATEDDDAQDVKDIKPPRGKQEQAFQGKSVEEIAKDRDAIVNDVKSFLKEKTHGMSLTEGMAFLKKHFQANEMTDLNSRSNEELKRLLSNAMNYKEEKKVSTHRFQVDF